MKGSQCNKLARNSQQSGQTLGTEASFARALGGRLRPLCAGLRHTKWPVSVLSQPERVKTLTRIGIDGSGVDKDGHCCGMMAATCPPRRKRYGSRWMSRQFANVGAELDTGFVCEGAVLVVQPDFQTRTHCDVQPIHVKGETWEKVTTKNSGEDKQRGFGALPVMPKCVAVGWYTVTSTSMYGGRMEFCVSIWSVA